MSSSHLTLPGFVLACVLPLGQLGAHGFSIHVDPGHTHIWRAKDFVFTVAEDDGGEPMPGLAPVISYQHIDSVTASTDSLVDGDIVDNGDGTYVWTKSLNALGPYLVTFAFEFEDESHFRSFVWETSRAGGERFFKPSLDDPQFSYQIRWNASGGHIHAGDDVTFDVELLRSFGPVDTERPWTNTSDYLSAERADVVSGRIDVLDENMESLAGVDLTGEGVYTGRGVYRLSRTFPEDEVPEGMTKTYYVSVSFTDSLGYTVNSVEEGSIPDFAFTVSHHHPDGGGDPPETGPYDITASPGHIHIWRTKDYTFSVIATETGNPQAGLSPVIKYQHVDSDRVSSDSLAEGDIVDNGDGTYRWTKSLNELGAYVVTFQFDDGGTTQFRSFVWETSRAGGERFFKPSVDDPQFSYQIRWNASEGHVHAGAEVSFDIELLRSFGPVDTERPWTNSFDHLSADRSDLTAGTIEILDQDLVALDGVEILGGNVYRGRGIYRFARMFPEDEIPLGERKTYYLRVAVTDDSGHSLDSTSAETDLGDFAFTVSRHGVSVEPVAMTEFTIDKAKVVPGRKGGYRGTLKGAFVLAREKDVTEGVVLTISADDFTESMTLIPLEKKRAWKYKRPKGAPGFVKKMIVKWDKNDPGKSAKKFAISIDSPEPFTVQPGSMDVSISLSLGLNEGGVSMPMVEKKGKLIYTYSHDHDDHDDHDDHHDHQH